MDAAAANALISRFSSDLTATTNRERRVAMSSPLYDLPGRSSLGFAIVGEIGPALVARLEAAMSAEEIGRRMRDVLVRPYFLQLFILFEGYLMGREQRLIEGGGIGDEREAARDAADTIAVCDWFARVCGAYRNGEALFPGAEVLDEPILDPERVAAWSGGEALAPELADRAQRAIGQLELYALTVHGEQRDGNFDHGPYPGPDGRQLLFHEVNDLDNDFLPWVEAGQRLGVDAVGVLRSFPAEAEISCDLFGTSSVAPAGTPFEQLALLVREGERVRALELEELEQIAAAATRATADLYRRIAGWEPEYRTAYGRPLFLNHLLPFLRIAGAPELEEWLVEAGEAAGPREVAAISGTGATAVWSRLAAGAEMFTPLRQAVAR